MFNRVERVDRVELLYVYTANHFWEEGPQSWPQRTGEKGEFLTVQNV